MALLMASVVLVRHAFGQGSIALQEAVMYTHGIVLMLGISYTLKQDAHVRVDLLYNRFNPTQKRWVNLCGHLFLLLPLCVTLLLMSLPYVSASWRVLEGSPEVGGIPGIFLLKTLIPVTAVLVALQALAEILRLLIQEPEQT
jgi:TRAP-type mannitol/chloroaromatic compound transport system permease small subunit